MERDIDKCVASIRGDNSGMGKSQAIAICRSRLEKKMSEQEKDQLDQPETADKGMHGSDRRRHEPERDHDKDDDEMRSSPSVMGATSFAQVREAERAQEAAREVRKLANQVPELVEGIFQDPNIEDKDAAIADLGPEFSAFVLEEMADTKERKWQPLTDAVVKAIAPLFGKKKENATPASEETPVSETPETKNSFTVWKEKSGRYRWMAHYSNNFRDRDNPPEIISKASHLNFVKEVNSGDVPYPELWLWHIDGSRWGEADFVGYDQGFAIATGLVDKGKEWIADSLKGDLLASHGMPKESVQRDSTDPTVIIRHTTKEISPILANVAANEYTGFSILDSEVKEMAFSEEDRAKLLILEVDPDTLEAMTDEKAKATEGLEKKEADKPEAAKETADSNFVDRDEVNELVKSVATSTNQLVQVVGDLAKRLETLEANKLTLDQKTVEETPGASLADYYKSVIGSPETKVDGRSSLAKQGPEEAKPDLVHLGGGLAAVISQRNQEIERGGVQ